jgi:hypothetical protein
MYDKVMAHADYKKTYYISELETRLQYCLHHFKSAEPDILSKLSTDLQLVRNEIIKEINNIGQANQPWIDQLNPTQFDSLVYRQAIDFMAVLKRFYINRYNKAEAARENKIRKMTDTPDKEKAFNRFKEEYRNESIADFVKNLTEPHKIIERDGKLIQKIYPVYKDPDPDHMVDFDAQFYMPFKHFLNRNIDTLLFNTGVIWSMTLFLIITLYFDILRKLVDGIGNLSNPLNRRV